MVPPRGDIRIDLLSDTVTLGLPLHLDTDPPATNIAFFRIVRSGWTTGGFLTALARRGIRMGELGANRVRAVTHYGVESSDIELALQAVREVMSYENEARA